MIDSNRLLSDGYAEFDYILGGKEYNVRLYLYDTLKNYYNVVVPMADMSIKLIEFLDNLVLVLEFEVYHALLLVNETSLTSFIRLYNIQVEVAEKGYRNPLRMVPEITVMNFNQHRLTMENKKPR